MTRVVCQSANQHVIIFGLLGTRAVREVCPCTRWTTQVEETYLYSDGVLICLNKIFSGALQSSGKNIVTHVLAPLRGKSRVSKACLTNSIPLII